MSKNAVCRKCGCEVPLGDDFGNVDMRMKTSEHSRDLYGIRKNRRTRRVMRLTLCEGCMDALAGVVGRWVEE